MAIGSRQLEPKPGGSQQWQDHCLGRARATMRLKTFNGIRRLEHKGTGHRSQRQIQREIDQDRQ